MKTGRPNKGFAHLDSSDGTAEQKRRVELILATITGDLGVDQACKQLGISPSRFAVLRTEVLQGALDAIAPGKPGRPAKVQSIDPEEHERLLREKRDLEIEARAAEVREAIALVMPELLDPRRARRLKKRGPKRGRGSR